MIRSREGSPRGGVSALLKETPRAPLPLPTRRYREAAGCEAGRGLSRHGTCRHLDLAFRSMRKKCLWLTSRLGRGILFERPPAEGTAGCVAGDGRDDGVTAGTRQGLTAAQVSSSGVLRDPAGHPTSRSPHKCPCGPSLFQLPGPRMSGCSREPGKEVKFILENELIFVSFMRDGIFKRDYSHGPAWSAEPGSTRHPVLVPRVWTDTNRAHKSRWTRTDQL